MHVFLESRNAANYHGQMLLDLKLIGLYHELKSHLLPEAKSSACYSLAWNRICLRYCAMNCVLKG